LDSMIEIAAEGGHRLAAYLASPADPPRGGLVVIQTAFGLDDHLRGVCHSYAADGYVAIAPALYDRQQRNAVFAHDAQGGPAAQKLRNGLVMDDVLRDVEAARRRVAGAGKVGVVGFCVGGSIAWLAANALNFAAAACYYGKDIVDSLDKAPRCPAILHFGDQDPLIPASDVEKIRVAFPDIPNFVYHAGHGFDANSPEAARPARTRTLQLLRQYVG
jgi:carboxymethylenebutenolidase